MKRDSFNVLFFIKKAKLLKNGEASVCMRITVNGARVENNIRKSIEPALWNQAKECAKGKSRKSCDLNAYIEDARIKLHQTFKELEEQGLFITARLLQEKFFGQDQAPEVVRTLIQTIQEHNDQCRELVGKDYALITVRRYESCKRYLAELIKQKYGKEDLPLSEVNGELVRSFEFYLKTEKECQQNTVIRYMKCLKKITNLALANEWITKDPFIGIKFHEKEVIRDGCGDIPQGGRSGIGTYYRQGIRGCHLRTMVPAHDRRLQPQIAILSHRVQERGRRILRMGILYQTLLFQKAVLYRPGPHACRQQAETARCNHSQACGERTCKV